jgi:hypothetical protein
LPPFRFPVTVTNTAPMSILRKLERRFGRHAMPGVIVYVIAVQVALYVLSLLAQGGLLGNRNIFENVILIPAMVRAGEWWRLVVFPFAPPMIGPLWAFFYWYLLYFFATTLELHWGSFRLNLYLLVGWLSTVLVALLVPALIMTPVTNGYLYSSVFLAFALLYPDYELYILFVLPVKVKWLALLAWLVMGYSVIEGGWPAFWMAAPTAGTFLLFLGSDVWQFVRQRWRSEKFRQRVRAGQSARTRLYHECRVCGLTSEEAPRTAFRYCSKCAGEHCYCPEHLESHEHVVENSPSEVKTRS